MTGWDPEPEKIPLMKCCLCRTPVVTIPVPHYFIDKLPGKKVSLWFDKKRMLETYDNIFVPDTLMNL